MRVAILLVAALLVTTASYSQLPASEKRYKGYFFLCVDDAVTLFVNGKEAFKFGVGTHQSPEIEIAEDDRIVARLHDQGGGCHFILAFKTSDEKNVASFKTSDFKVAPNNQLVDFTGEEFNSWKRHAQKIKSKVEMPVKNYSHDVWGYTMDCTLGVVITPDMFTQIPY